MWVGKNVYNRCSFRGVTPVIVFDMGGVLTQASRLFLGWVKIIQNICKIYIVKF